AHRENFLVGEELRGESWIVAAAIADRDLDHVPGGISHPPRRRHAYVDTAMRAMEAVEARHEPSTGEAIGSADIQRRFGSSRRRSRSRRGQLLERIANRASI